MHATLVPIVCFVKIHWKISKRLFCIIMVFFISWTVEYSLQQDFILYIKNVWVWWISISSPRSLCSKLQTHSHTGEIFLKGLVSVILPQILNLLRRWIIYNTSIVLNHFFSTHSIIIFHIFVPVYLFMVVLWKKSVFIYRYNNKFMY